MGRCFVLIFFRLSSTHATPSFHSTTLAAPTAPPSCSLLPPPTSSTLPSRPPRARARPVAPRARRALRARRSRSTRAQWRRRCCWPPCCGAMRPTRRLGLCWCLEQRWLQRLKCLPCGRRSCGLCGGSWSRQPSERRRRQGSSSSRRLARLRRPPPPRAPPPRGPLAEAAAILVGFLTSLLPGWHPDGDDPEAARAARVAAAADAAEVEAAARDWGVAPPAQPPQPPPVAAAAPDRPHQE